MFAGIEQSGLGDAVRNVPYLYPFLETLHLLGIALLLGSILAFDLRVLGVGRDALAVTTVARYLLPLARVGFAMAALTGLLMFTGVAVAVAASAAAPWKFGLILLAGINVAVFHRGVYRTVAAWDLQAMAPWKARVAAATSALGWVAVLGCGRLLAYI